MSPYQATQALDALLIKGTEVDSRISLAEEALLFAIENGQEFELEEQLKLIDDLSMEASSHIDISAGVSEIAKSLCYFFKEIKGFQGDSGDYYNPENSFLNNVIEQRKGIPISLAVLYISVANNLGFNDIAGVAFPGHFLLRLGGGEDAPEVVFVDPYYHTIINENEREKKLQSLFGKQARMHRSFLLTVDNRYILARMARNLTEIYQNKHQYELALVCCTRAISADPEHPDDHYIRATLYEALDCFTAAIQEFSRFIYLSPKDERIGEIKNEIRRLREAHDKTKYVH